MADKSIGELIAATQVTPLDLFVLEQNNTAKKLTGQTLENWLLQLAKGHGGIQQIQKTATNGLVDTYTITFSDTSTTTFDVTNAKSVVGIQKTATSGLVDTYTISFNDKTSTTFEVSNGAKGDTGQAWYIWIKYASQKPTEGSASMGDLPDAWMGIYSGTESSAPISWQAYSWYEIKGAKGDTGAPSTVLTASVEYQASSSGNIPPSGEWTLTVPPVAQGQYLWSRITITFNTGDPIISYSVARMGMDGKGAVATVNSIVPGPDGNVQLTASDVSALPDRPGVVGTDKLAQGAVTEEKLAPKTVTQSKIGDAAVASAKLAAEAVTRDKLAAEAVTRDKLAAEAVTRDKIAQGAVDRLKLANDALSSPMRLADVSYQLTTADIGGTVAPASTQALSITLSAANSAPMPLGAEIAVLWSQGSTAPTVTPSGGVKLAWSEQPDALISTAMQLTGLYSLAALKLISKGNSGADTWLITGQVEGVS